MMNPRPVTDGWLEDDALIVTFAVPLGLDAVVAGWPFLSTFDATLATCEAAGLGPLAKLWIAGSSVGRGVSHVCNRRQVASLSSSSWKLRRVQVTRGKRDPQGTRTRSM